MKMHRSYNTTPLSGDNAINR